jgi:hypothetical protein
MLTEKVAGENVKELFLGGAIFLLGGQSPLRIPRPNVAPDCSHIQRTHQFEVTG